MTKAARIIPWAIGAGVILALLASIQVPAIVGGPVPSYMKPELNEMRNGLQVYRCLQAYSQDNGGQFPPALRNLVPTYLSTDAFEALESHGPRLDEWFYFPNPPRDDLQAIILASPHLYFASTYFWEPANGNFIVVPLLADPRLYDSNASRVAISLGNHTYVPQILRESVFFDQMSKQLKAGVTHAH